MPADATNSQIPAIRTFQFDSSSVGDLSSSVNLFRGDINFTQTLLSMPGRTAGVNLDLTLSLLYQSNVHEDAITWNRDAPTGALGLGWSMPAPTIVLNDAGSLMPATRSYGYVSQSISTDLAREPTTPFVFSMAGALADSLANGGTVPAAVVAAFGAHGLVLSPASRVSSTGTSAWQLADDANQQLYDLALDGATLNVFDQPYVLNGASTTGSSVMMQTYFVSFQDLDFGQGYALSLLVTLVTLAVSFGVVATIYRKVEL